MNEGGVKGLTDYEAKKRLSRFGYNEIPDHEKRKFIKILLSLLSEPMIFLLLATVMIYFFLGDKREALFLTLSIFGIIGIELYQEGKTEKSLEALRNLSSPICNVIRSGRKIVIPGREVVVGDIIMLAEGSRVPADAKLISAESLMADESMLTGESVPVEKHTREVEDYRTNTVFSGTLIVRGHALAEVTAIGSETEFGKIGKSLQSINTEKTLLQKEVSRIIKIIALMAVASSLLLTFLYFLTRGDLVKGFLAGLTLAIAIIPEEFPVVLVVFLTLGAWRLAKSNVLVRRAQTIETLGSASVICVDKTGTLTENRMKVFEIRGASGDKLSHGSAEYKRILEIAVLASQRKPFDPMEEAFLQAAKGQGLGLEDIYGKEGIIREYPLEEKSLCVVHVWAENGTVRRIAAKGAPETIFGLCHLIKSEKTKLEAEVKILAKDGFRIIAVAKGVPVSKLPRRREEIRYEFLGLVALADPIRAEVAGAVSLCHSAGARVVMITGDYPETAAHIAKEIGLESGTVYTGSDFANLPVARQREVVQRVSVFSRVTPSHKLAIVQALRECGEVVAMTGDGVNDAPALKAAHIGIAMGKRGTDVAREAAAIVLLDDNFASIVDGVKLGRRIYANLRKAISYLVSVHVPIASLALVPIALGWPEVLLPVHVVFLEFIIDPSATLIFESEEADPSAMKRPPRKLNEPVFNRSTAIESLIRGVIIAITMMAVNGYLITLNWPIDKIRGMVFLILVFANILLVLTISGRKAVSSIFGKEERIMLIILMLTTLALALIFALPFLRESFHFLPLSPLEFAFSFLLGSLAVLVWLPFKYLVRLLIRK